MEVAAPYSRIEHFTRVDSTNDIVRGWLAGGEDEVAVAYADEQTAGRGRAGRSWTAPPGTSLLISTGFRPTYLRPEATWRLGAIVAVAMAQAAEVVAGIRAGTISLKWPNDLVVEQVDGFGKLGGVLGETEGLGSADVRAVMGIGLNVDWTHHRIPPDLAPTMTTLADVGGEAVAVDDVRTVFLEQLSLLVIGLRDGSFPAAEWRSRQVTSGRAIVLELAGGVRREGIANGVDDDSGALLIREPDTGTNLPVHAADVVHVRLSRQGMV